MYIALLINIYLYMVPYILPRLAIVGLGVKNLYIYVGVILVAVVALTALSLATGFPFQLRSPSETGAGLAYVITPNYSVVSVAVNSTAGNITIPIPGKINVMTFQYLRCPNYCHWESYVLVYLMNKTVSSGLSGDIVFVTIDVDPWRDTYEDITSYQKSRAGGLLNKASWVWVLDDIGKMTEVWSNFRIFVARNPDDLSITHSVGFYIFDRNGKILYYVQPTDNGWENLDKLAPWMWDLLYKVAKS